jgi:hypothetical protein
MLRINQSLGSPGGARCHSFVEVLSFTGGIGPPNGYDPPETLIG